MQVSALHRAQLDFYFRNLLLDAGLVAHNKGTQLLDSLLKVLGVVGRRARFREILTHFCFDLTKSRLQGLNAVIESTTQHVYILTDLRFQSL